MPASHSNHSRQVCSAICVLFLSGFAVASLQAQQSATYIQAKQAFAEKHFSEAARLFAAEALAEVQVPVESRSDALLMQARSLVYAGDLTAAEPAVQAFLKQDSRSAPGLYLLGFVLERENRPRDSLKAFNRAAAISIPRPEDLRLVALDYVLLDEYSEAVRWLKRAVAGDPENAEAWYDLGRAQMHLGDFVGAEHDFLRALTMDPQGARVLNNLGLCYEAQNLTDKALGSYRRAVEADKDAPHPSEQPLLNLGALLNSRNRSAEAVGVLRQAVTLSPNCFRCHEELSRAYSSTHQTDAARKEMESAVALDRQNPALHYQLGRICKLAGDSACADRELKISADLYGAHSATVEEGQSNRPAPSPPRP